MKYRIVVDKQSRTNPSNEKKVYEIDIEELRCKGDVCDTLVINRKEAYVMRRLELTEYFVLNVLKEPIKQPIPNVDIELFEGDNYIYIVDMVGNKFHAEYLIKNDFNDTYVTKSEMRSAVNQSAQAVEISVSEKLEGYSTTTQTQALIKALSKEISLEVEKKVGNNEIISKINMTPEKVKILAKLLELEGVTTINGGFKIDKEGNMEAVNGTFIGGKITLDGGDDIYNAILEVYSTYNPHRVSIVPSGASIEGPSACVSLHHGSEQTVLLYTDSSNGKPGLFLYGYGTGSTRVESSGINTPSLTQTSLASIKKNIKKLNKNALDIIKDADIYVYNLKSDKDTDKKHIGFVIGKGYNTPEEVLNEKGDAVELYSAIGLLWKGLQELIERIDNLEENLKN